jgi:hypothetical protein
MSVPLLKSEVKEKQIRRASLREEQRAKRLNVETQGPILNVPNLELSESSSEFVRSDEDEDDIVNIDFDTNPPSPEILIEIVPKHDKRASAANFSV